jgi:hypothetical protein
MNHDARLLRAILHRAVARYLRVSPKGLHLASDPVPSAFVNIVDWGPARTLYRNRKPACRSLDGAVSVTHPDRHCDRCTFNKHCTGQVRVDLLVTGKPYRLLLSYTSAKNFLIYQAELQDQRVKIEDILHRIEVIDRGSFGEVRFSRPQWDAGPGPK